MNGNDAAPAVMPRDLLARALYIDEQGACLGKRRGRIVIRLRSDDEATDDERGEDVPISPRVSYRAVPIVNIEQLVLVGNVQLSAQLLAALASAGVDVVYLSTRGRFKGRFVPEFDKDAELRVAQYAAHADEDMRLDLSRAFVGGKLRNMATVLARHARRRKDPAIADAAATIAASADKAASAAYLGALRGVEGAASREYFDAFGVLVPDWTFSGRTRRPPKDPVNALLSFGYAILMADIIAACYVAGMDPYIGLLHTLRYGRPALALDLMEEFRPIVIDSVVLRILNRSMVSEDDFESRGGGVFLNAGGRAVFFREYVRRKQERVTHPIFRYRLPYHRMFEVQARFLAKVLRGEMDAYIPFMVR